VLIEHLAAAGCLNLDNLMIENMRTAVRPFVVEHNWNFVLPATTAYVTAHVHIVAPVFPGVWAGGTPVPELDAFVIQPACFKYVGYFYRRLIVIPCVVE
jgi:hypothetical protein